MKIKKRFLGFIFTFLLLLTNQVFSQLAATPWPMVHHDLQHTSRSSFIGPNTGIKKYSVPVGTSITSNQLAIGSGGTIYVGTGDGKLFALDSNGNEIWNVTLSASAIYTVPAIASDGTIYVGTSSKFYALNSNGSTKWELPIAASSPAIASDNTIYVGTTNGLCAVNPDGTIKWNIGLGGSGTTPAIASDGTIYVMGNDIYAVNPDGSIKWSYAVPPGAANISVGSDATVYAGINNILYALNNNGSKKWEYNTAGVGISSMAPAIAGDGTIYITVYTGTLTGILYAFNSDGTVKWTLTTDKELSTPAIDSAGTIYLGSSENKLYAINPDGTIKWTFLASDIVGSPIIANNDYIYFTSDNNLYSITKGIPIPSPSISSVNPNTGLNTTSINVTITGADFQTGATVKLQKTGETDIVGTATNSVNANKITTTLNLTGVATGNWDVVVTNPDGQSAVLPNGFTVYAPAPSITTINPNNANNTGVVNVAIIGSNFLNGAVVKLQKTGETDIIGLVNSVNSFQINASFDLTGVVAGSWDVVVINPDGQSATLVNAFTINAVLLPPTITSINPNTAENTGIITATITGTNFQNGITAKLTKTGQPNIVGVVTFIDASHIQVNFNLTGTVDGSWDVVVTNPNGQSVTLTNGFTVILPPPAIIPAITSIIPNSVPNFMPIDVTINGTNFKPGITAKLQLAGKPDINCTNITFINFTKITCTVDVTDVAIGNYDVVVINPDMQTGILPNGFNVYAAVPNIISVMPNIGYNNETTYIKVEGNFFKQGLTINLEAVDKPTISCTDIVFIDFHTVKCKLDLVGVATGQYNLVLTNPDGVSTTVSNGFTVYEPPIINSINPNYYMYPNSNVLLVNIIGSNFLPGVIATLVKVDQSVIYPCIIQNVLPNNISCFVLAKEVGLYNVVVKNPFQNGTSELPSAFTVVTGPADIDVRQYTGIFRRGHVSEIRISIMNVGGDVANNVVVYNMLPPSTPFISASDGGVYDGITHTIRWNLGNINPQINKILRIQLIVDVNTPLNTILVNKTTASTTSNEIRLDNNIAILTASVRGSQDPNYKASSPQGFINNNQTIGYYIEFENEGNAEAIDIKVTDTLDENLEPATFEYISDNGKYDADTRTISWEFPNINLPPKGTGFITYALKPKADLPIGTQIKNKALVYFDFNPAVETPEVVNTIGDPNAVKSQDLTLEILLLKQRINALDITNKQGFIAKLDAAYNKLQTAIENIQADNKKLAEQNIETAINELEALKNLIKAQEGKKLSKQLAQELKEQTESIMEQLENLKENLEGNEIAENEKKDKALNIFEVSKVLLLPNPLTSANLNQKEKIKLLVDATGQINSAKIEIYTSNGKKVSAEELLAAPQGNGKFKFSSPSLDASITTLPNGIYFYRVVISDGVNEVSKVGKIVILK